MHELHEAVLRIERALGGGTGDAYREHSYRWKSHRGDETFEALMSSVYARQPDGAWKLVLHQQTPLSP